jgi:hypothetical protein
VAKIRRVPVSGRYRHTKEHKNGRNTMIPLEGEIDQRYGRNATGRYTDYTTRITTRSAGVMSLKDDTLSVCLRIVSERV